MTIAEANAKDPRRQSNQSQYEVRANDGNFRFGRTWAFLIRFVCPIAITLILINLVQTLLAN